MPKQQVYKRNRNGSKISFDQDNSNNNRYLNHKTVKQTSDEKDQIPVVKDTTMNREKLIQQNYQEGSNAQGSEEVMNLYIYIYAYLNL